MPTRRSRGKAIKDLGLSFNGVARLFALAPLTGHRWAANGVKGPAEILLKLLLDKTISVADIERVTK